HCVHCYADCYNNAKWAKENELSTKQIKKLMDRLYDSGVLWFTFTGGDPMIREDFSELYDYAKRKGFIFSIMTSLVSLNDEILEMMKKEPPFSIDMTLNAVDAKTYEDISQVPGSFERVMNNIDKVIKAGLPLKIKTLISKKNIDQMEDIKAFIESKGMTFSPSTSIFSRLNGDPSNCVHRLSFDQMIGLGLDKFSATFDKDNIDKCDISTVEKDAPKDVFYKCAIGNWQWHIDPRGRLNICSCVREPYYDLLNGDLIEGVKELSKYVRSRKYEKQTECSECKIWYLCNSCPGKADLELKDENKPVPYYCELAKRKAIMIDRANREHLAS
ncbi:MAG: radical SAM protein, partial [Candidatus Omnitrophica bacterium]|nr:radical SAM protein [Candidatus Omnitrophota bacterium]